MFTKFKKCSSKMFLGLISCLIITQNQCVHAGITNPKKLLRDAYMVRLEYRSNSCASQKLKHVINLLEEFQSVVWDKTTNWFLNMNVEMVFDNCSELQNGKLCSPITPHHSDNTITKLSPYVVADFGESLCGNIWQLKKVNDEMTLEKKLPDIS